MLPRPTIEAFDAHLLGLGLRLEAIVVGGSALALLGVTSRQTRDFDIIAPEIPRTILEAAKTFAREQRERGIDLLDDWLNNGPIQLGDVLPEGWRLRVVLAFEGKALVLHSLGRADLLKTKLEAMDRGGEPAGRKVPQAEVCARCRAVFRELDLVQDACTQMASGQMPPQAQPEQPQQFAQPPMAQPPMAPPAPVQPMPRLRVTAPGSQLPAPLRS
jgi:hypothetical protein